MRVFKWILNPFLHLNLLDINYKYVCATATNTGTHFHMCCCYTNWHYRIIWTVYRKLFIENACKAAIKRIYSINHRIVEFSANRIVLAFMAFEIKSKKAYIMVAPSPPVPGPTDTYAFDAHSNMIFFSSSKEWTNLSLWKSYRDWPHFRIASVVPKHHHTAVNANQVVIIYYILWLMWGRAMFLPRDSTETRRIARRLNGAIGDDRGQVECRKRNWIEQKNKVKVLIINNYYARMCVVGFVGVFAIECECGTIDVTVVNAVFVHGTVCVCVCVWWIEFAISCIRR